MAVLEEIRKDELQEGGKNMSRRKTDDSQMTLFAKKERKARVETEYRDTTSANGTFCPTLNSRVTKRLVRYCKATNQSKTKFVESCIEKQLDLLERETYESMEKEELVNLLLQLSERSRHDDL